MFGTARKLGRRGTTNTVDPDTPSSSSSQSFTNIPAVSASPPSALPIPPSTPPILPSTPPIPPSTPSEQFQHDEDATDSNNEVASSDYAKKCKALMELYRDLRSLGADMFFELPKIAVIGAQSAGKSSLIEAISGGYFRSAFLEIVEFVLDLLELHRCPVDLSMSSFVDEWSCTISLRIEYDESGQQQGNSTSIPFCTLSSNGKTCFSTRLIRTNAYARSVIPEKSSVDLWLRRAQASILCRYRPISDFQNMTLEELRRLKPGDGFMLSFSMNVIHVHLEDPEATDLTFVDLPGLIQNASESEIGLAQGLVKKNIEGDKTLILITIPMSDEMENQEAVRLAKQADPSGIRTIGVLTKPDTITRGAIGSRQRWKEVLQGKIHPLHHGYYCVRLADDNERSRRLSRTESEELSAEFFANNDPWNDFVNRSRFGVPNFVKDISRLLLGLIETKELREAVMGKDHRFLVHNNRHHYEAFKSAIERTQPDFWPFISKENYRNPGLHTQGGSVGQLTWELPGIIPYDAIQNTSSTVEKLVARHFGQFTKLETLINYVSPRKVAPDMKKANGFASTPRYIEILLGTLSKHLSAEPLGSSGGATESSPAEAPVAHQSWNIVDSAPVPRSPSPVLVPSPSSTSYDDELFGNGYSIEHELNQTFSEKIQQTLVEDIMSGPDVAGRMKDLLSEDEAIASRRQFLEQRLERLKEIKEKLYQFDLAA
ncbi:P-loop containing nucleoside triphosphate hydrolase protein [Gymnopus androsaceus JB14]|uniref:P-loop containing nucleoside triphosphate hydrolase protein n=1 Tax=Gymnopus androsaceus JB14 TaxID=1447944 RepID=A0A6A4HQF8_9AGAR|nr:P-loop containing nucleoside triphosphate hydrolase protein [Gymnopus androsaceus JB14]